MLHFLCTKSSAAVSYCIVCLRQTEATLFFACLRDEVVGAVLSRGRRHQPEEEKGHRVISLGNGGGGGVVCVPQLLRAGWCGGRNRFLLASPHSFDQSGHPARGGCDGPHQQCRLALTPPFEPAWHNPKQNRETENIRGAHVRKRLKNQIGGRSSMSKK